MNPINDAQPLIAISRQQYLEKLNAALGSYSAQGYRFFASPNHLHPCDIDWLRSPEADPIYISALESVESRYRIIPEDIVPDNVGSAFGEPPSEISDK